MYFASPFGWLKPSTFKRDYSETLRFFTYSEVWQPIPKISNQHWSTLWLDLNCFVVPIACIYELIKLWNIKIERFEMPQSCFYCTFMLISTAKILNKCLVYIVSSKISKFSAPKITYFIPFLPYNRSFLQFNVLSIWILQSSRHFEAVGRQGREYFSSKLKW